jgi:hypothetical protein
MHSLKHVKDADRKALRSALATPHEKSIRVASLSNDGKALEDYSDQFEDGQVNGDASGDVSRQLNLTLFDPRGRIPFDADTIGTGDLDLSRMLRVQWTIDSPLLSELVTIPVFTGPLSAMDRQGPRVVIEAVSKESFGLGAVWQVMTLGKNLRKTDAIRRLLVVQMGETRIDIPDLDARLPKAIKLPRTASPWRAAQRIARSMNMQLYYDASGTVRMRRRQDEPHWRFSSGGHAREGWAPNLTSPITARMDRTKVRNAVIVKGGKPKGAKHPVAFRAVAPRDHPMSPWRLGRENAPLFLVEEISDSKIRSVREARERAEDHLARGLRAHVTAQFTATPVPMFDVEDVFHAADDRVSLESLVRTFSLPLGVAGDMTMGFTRNVGLKPRDRRNR